MAAYLTLGSALVLTVVQSGVYWIVGSAGMAVVLGLGELVIQLHGRHERALQLGLKFAGGFGALVAFCGVIALIDSYIAQGEYLTRGVVVAIGGTMLSLGAYAAARRSTSDQRDDAAV